MVVEALGALPPRPTRPRTADSAEDIVAWLVIRAASHLDHVHAQFTDAAQGVASMLDRVSTGKSSINSLGVLQSRGLLIDILAARRADAVEHLKEAIHAYQRVTAFGNRTAQPARRAGPGPVPPGPPPTPAGHNASTPRPH
ncbi:hypothetical protein [Streptomyces sp. NPDC057682]|uniref:hypothetical protein n=1 Tax=Streptomyces sp. NPDC057682 TaxID=3346210 RepID=UPI0036C942B9